MERDNYKCRLCGKKPSAQVHHITPRGEEGETELPNLITLCGKCHMLLSPVLDKIVSDIWKIPLDKVKSERVKIKNSLESNINLKIKRTHRCGSMKCKVFNIRLSENYDESGELALNEFLENIKVSRIFSSVICGKIPFWSVLIFYEDKTEGIKHSLSTEEITLTPAEEELYEALRRWRNEQAAKEGFAPYMIAHNSWLKQMVKMHVKTKEDLLQIKGFGKKRTEKYGDYILRVVELFFTTRKSEHGK